MAQQKKVSVIVPVYNSEKYLNTCLESILNQTLKDIEIICVDDGSTDSSPDILEHYRSMDSRITVLHQKNQYAGVARNRGMSQAIGEYLVFWDSDDYFYPDALEQMYAQCEMDQADVCVCGANQFWEDLQMEVPAAHYLNKKLLPDKIPFNRHTNPGFILNFTGVEPWNKMFRRKYIDNWHLCFQSVRTANDIYFVANALCLAECITTVDKPLVCYRKGQTTNLTATLSNSPLSPFRSWIDTAANLRALEAFPEQSFVNRALVGVFFQLHNMNDWESFRSAVVFLQQEGLEKLSIQEKSPEYFYTEWHYSCLKHLLTDSPECFLAYFSRVDYLQHMQIAAQKRVISKKYRAQRNSVRKLRKENEKLRKEIQELKSSNSYCVGHKLMWLPGKIKRLFMH